MRSIPLLLRALLCLAMLCNGAAQALAAAHADDAHAGVAAMAIPAGDAPSCCEHSRHAPPPAHDCGGKSGACLCAGAHCMAAPVQSLQVPALAVRVRVAHESSAGHAEPALSDLQRPPISSAS